MQKMLEINAYSVTIAKLSEAPSSSVESLNICNVQLPLPAILSSVPNGHIA